MMNRDEFLKFLNSMDNKPKEVYKIFKSYLLRDSYINCNPTIWNGIDSKNSLSFDFNGSSIINGLKRTFKITNNDFDYLFDQACSGSGKEENRITVLRSSSLCALLFFHNVSKKPINIPIDDNKTVRFNEVFFEVQNTVISYRNPSNIDIVLVSKEDKIILYLESKFAEYYLSNGSIEVSTGYLCKEDCKVGHQLYKQISNDIVFKRIGLKINYDSGKDGVFKIESEKNIADKNNKKKYVSYCGGIKQMISHYIGLANFVDETLCKDDKYNRNEKLYSYYHDENYKVYLGEILFDFENSNITPFMEDYKEKYHELAKYLNKIQPEKITCLKDVLLYSQKEIKNYIKDNNSLIFDFYFGK